MNKLHVQFHYSNINPLINILLSLSRTCLLNLIDFSTNEKSLIVDIGCSSGTLTRVLSLKAPTVGLDINKNTLVWVKKHARHVDFVCADITHLPFRNDSVDIAVMASVLEHVVDLEEAARQIRFVIKKDGMLVAGYPIETKLVKAIIELISKRTVSVWDPRRVMSHEDYLACPHTHKQNFFDIRNILHKYFSVFKKAKIPSTRLPDFLSIYECVRLSKRPKATCVSNIRYIEQNEKASKHAFSEGA